MLEHRTGNILDAAGPGDAAWIVIPVNCRAGVMGKGLALAAARRWPGLSLVHRCQVENCGLLPGVVHFYKAAEDRPGLVLFPTKDDWRKPSLIGWIESGLEDMEWVLYDFKESHTIHVPRLGCGLGGLDFSEVRPFIERTALATQPHRWVLWTPQSEG